MIVSGMNVSREMWMEMYDEIKNKIDEENFFLKQDWDAVVEESGDRGDPFPTIVLNEINIIYGNGWEQHSLSKTFK
jgi:hypothetical protein